MSASEASLQDERYSETIRNVFENRAVARVDARINACEFQQSRQYLEHVGVCEYNAAVRRKAPDATARASNILGSLAMSFTRGPRSRQAMTRSLGMKAGDPARSRDAAAQ